MHLLDTNVWLALAFDSHVHHPKAKTWFDALPEDAKCYFCRLTQQGFLRLATNQGIFGKHALSMVDAWKAYDAFLSDPRIAFAPESAAVESQWRHFSQKQTFSPRIWNDAYLAGFALVAMLELVTFDKGFLQFAGLHCNVL